MTGQRIAHPPDGVDPDVYGLAEVVRAGDLVFVSGQSAYDAGAPDRGLGDLAGQMRAAYAKVAAALAKVGCGLGDVVDETLFVTDTRAAVAAARAVRAEAYGGRYDLASTLCEVAGFADPAMQVEIKCVAVAGNGG